ncbi:hypothetical protein C1N71_14255 [Agrococcus sp. SGAir0287]|nr:hypothetical protein C1N71_14255 [Agrococcus sp. SGAir0287]
MVLPIEAVSRRDVGRRLVQLVVGLWLYGVGIALMVRAEIGVSPWDVLTLGIQRQTGLGFGLVIVLTSVVVLLLWIPLRQRVGVGTLLNGLLVGPFAELTLAIVPPVPTADPATWWFRAPLFLVGLVTLAVATGMYITARFGPGPRDGLMTGVVRVTGWPIWVVRTLIEGSVLVVGLLLGGPVGVGTLVFAFGVGPLVGRALPWFERRRSAAEAREAARVAALPTAG